MKIKLLTLLVLLSTNAFAYDYNHMNNDAFQNLQMNNQNLQIRERQIMQDQIDREMLRSLQRQNNNYAY